MRHGFFPAHRYWIFTVLLGLLLFPIHVAKGEDAGVAQTVNLARGMSYWISQQPEASYPDSGTELTDGIQGSTTYTQGPWQGHLRGQYRVVTVDLEHVRPIHEVKIGFLNDHAAGIFLPDQLMLQTSVNGREWTEPIAIAKHELGYQPSPLRKEISFDDVNVDARYVRIIFFVDIWVFADEIEVWGDDRIVDVDGPTDLLDMEDPYLGLRGADRPVWRGDKVPETPQNAYFPPGSPDAAGVEHMALIYTHSIWRTGEALPYVAYAPRENPRKLDMNPIWKDWLFDTFLFLALQTPDGRSFVSNSMGGVPVTWDDWLWFLDFLFTPNQQLAAFDAAVARAKRTIDDPDYKAKVVVMIPYPISSTVDFGDVHGTGESVSFASFPQGEKAQRAARFGAVKAYVNELEARWDAHEFDHLELVGLYWLAEEFNGYEDLHLVQDVSELVKARGMKFFWIPYYGASGWARWEEAGFDVAIYQPNYMFNDRVPLNRLKEAADQARRYGLGVEIEGDTTVLTSAQRRERYLAYLRAGVEYGFMNEAIHGYYQDRNMLLQAWISTDPEVRHLYDATYQYVKGIYKPDDM